MATSTLSIASTTTFGGIVTAYVPLPSSQPSVIACSTQIYAGGDDGSAMALAFDPYFAMNVLANEPPCLADVITSWWWQGTTSSVVTSLGPNFECPPLYYGNSVEVGGGTTRIYCCPTSYTMQSTDLNIPNVATQCYSRVRSSTLLIYTSSTDSPYTRVLMTVGDQFTIWAPHVNGINVGPETTSSSTILSTSSPSSSATTTTSSDLTSSTNTPAASSNSPTSSATGAVKADSEGGKSKTLSAGAAAGIGVGATLLLLGLGVGAFFLWRRRKRNSTAYRAELPGFNNKEGLSLATTPYAQASEMAAREFPAHEISSKEGPYEIGMENQRYEAYQQGRVP